VGAGAFGMNSDFDDEEGELAWMTKLAKETGRPVWFLLTDRYEDPARWRRLLAAVHAAAKDGAPLTAQIAGRPIGVMMGIGTLQFGKHPSITAPNRSSCLRTSRCAISCTTMYSRHSRGFLARSVLSRMLRLRGLRLPHLVFIRCTKKRATFTPMGFPPSDQIRCDPFDLLATPSLQ
jgi:hypothetical protein